MNKISKKVTIWSTITLGVVVVLVTVSLGGHRFGADGNNDQAHMSTANQPAEKVEVVHFHATQQCWSCTTVGEFALKTITERFPEEYKNGTIVYRDVNVELAENKDLTMKYRATGASLFINAITAGQDTIQEDVNVWRYTSNEMQFINYFEKKLTALLGT